MRKLIAVAFLAAMATPVLAQTAPPSVSVAGEATVTAAPDIALIEAGVTSEGKTARQTTQGASGGAMKITGYRASNRVIVTLRDIANVAGTIDALVGAGANDIGGISFSVSQSSKLLDEARSKAVEDAHRKAALYAQATGMTLGSPLAISEDGAPPPMVFRKMAVGAAATPIAPGEQTLRVAVNVVYELKPKTP
jgi:uncharacterized protein YggE